jgi:hypothetical protein
VTRDERCCDLVESILYDQPDWFERSYQYREESRDKLTKAIQATIEHWIASNIRSNHR